MPNEALDLTFTSLACTSAAPTGYGSLFLPALQTLAALAIVIGLIYLLLHRLLPRLIQRAQQGKVIRLIERVPLDQKHALFLIEIYDEKLLLGGGEQTLSVIKTFSQEDSAFTEEAPFLNTNHLKADRGHEISA